MVPVTVLPGVTGPLVASAFLATTLEQQQRPTAAVAATVRRVHRWWRRVERTLGPASSLRAIADIGALPFFEIFDYEPQRMEPQRNGFVGTFRARTGAEVAVRVSTWGDDPDAAWRDTVRLSRTAGTRWGFVYTGRSLRIVDAARPWSRRSLDVDLPIALEHDHSSSALVLLMTAAARATPDNDSLDRLVERSEQHGVAVCATLGTGVLEALRGLLAQLDRRSRSRAHEADVDVFEQALTIVYRILFLLFAEARSMVPTWHDVYRDAYTIDALWRRTLHAPDRRGLWKALQAIGRLAHTGCRAGDLVVTPFNGRLFSPRHTPLAERAHVPDRVVGDALVALATVDGRGGRQRIAYGDLGVEQLGAVYERVLEYEPVRDKGRVRLSRTSHDRKSSGSFYTPRSVTDFLVRRVLHPVVVGKSADEILALRVLDPAMGSGAFLVAACRYLGGAVARARIAQDGAARQPTPTELADARRMVAQRCLYGVDRNPMAVQLARLSLWLASLSSDRPLTFLDHHLATGDSLIGASLGDLTRIPHPGRSRRRHRADLPLLDLDPAGHLASSVLPERFRIATEPDDTPSAVQRKERALLHLAAPGAPLARWKEAANLWCAAWASGDHTLAGGVYVDLLGSLTGGGGALPPRQQEALLARVREIARAHRFFHWELEFPEAFFTESGHSHPGGGFDVVVGNPPWDVLRADTGADAARRRMRTEQAAQLRFFREAGVYRHHGTGHANRYQLFLERAIQLTKPGGRLAMVLPSGLLTDHGSAPLRRELLETVDIERLIGFDNRAAIFPIHRDMRFLLMTGVKGAPTRRIAGSMGRSDVAWLDTLPDSASDDTETRGVLVPRATLEAWDPERLSIPWLTDHQDADILAMVANEVPQLGDSGHWNVRFGRELNATDDRHHFVPRHGPDNDALLTIFEGKHLEPFRVNAAAATLAIPKAIAGRVIDAATSFARWRVAYRDVASATNRVTLIAAVLPPRTLSTHTVFCSKRALGDGERYCLLALLNSLVANYLVRVQVTTHVTCAVMARLRVPRPPSSSTEFRELASLARILSENGVAGQEATFARLNAIVAGLYRLSQTQYGHILSTFPLLPAPLLLACATAFEVRSRDGRLAASGIP